MAQVPPFHSSKNPGVFHICSKCTGGNNIKPHYKTQGTGGGTLCDLCKRLSANGGC